jgi:chaperonin cofactor prefoldin
MTISEMATRISTLEAQNSEQATRIGALENDLSAAEGLAQEAQNRATQLEARAGTAEARVTALEAEARTADTRAREMAGASGVAPVPKGQGAQEGAASQEETLRAKLKATTDPAEKFRLCAALRDMAAKSAA